MKQFFKNYFPRFIGLYRAVRFEISKNNKPKRTMWGFLFTGNKIMSSGLFEVTETALVRKLLEQSDILINVGANIGYYCCHALSLDKKVIAFEPMQNNLFYLYKNIKLNDWEKIEVFPVALSQKNGLSEIYGDNTGASLIKGWANFESSYKTSIPTFIFDTLILQKIKNKKALIIIDIEGSEYDMLMGSKETLKMTPSPIWIVEIIYDELQPNNRKINPNFYKTFDLFFSNGYKAYDIKNNLSQVTDEIIDLHKNEFSNNISSNILFKK